MKKIAIVGAGGFGREVKSIIDDINKKNTTYNFLGFYDDAFIKGTLINNYPVLGKVKDINYISSAVSVVLGIGDPLVKFAIVKELNNKFIKFPNIIHPNSIIGDDFVKLGIGNVICSNSILTCNITVCDFVTINLMCTVGHDTIIKSYSSFMPSVNISGDVEIAEKVYIGTGAKIINQINIGNETIVGAGAVVSKNLPDKCTAVGIPAKPIKFHN